MTLRDRALLESKEARDLLDLLPTEALAPSPRGVALSGLSGVAIERLTVLGVRRLFEVGKTSLILVKDAATAHRLTEALRADGLSAEAYLERELVLYHITASHEEERRRLSVLTALLEGRLAAVVTTPAAALQYTIPRARLAACTLTLRAGEALEPERLLSVLVASGFLPVSTVEGAGQFAHRGGIVDFSADGAHPPVRVEFFGDEIDRIGSFDPLTQRLLEGLDSATVFPTREVIPDAAAVARIREDIKKRKTKLDKKEVVEALEAELAVLDSGHEISFADKYIDLIYPEHETLLSYFEDKGPLPLFLLGHSELLERAEIAERAAAETAAPLLADGALPRGFASMAAAVTLRRFAEAQYPLYFNSFASPPSGQRLAGLFGFSCRRTVGYGQKPELLRADLAAYRDGGYRILLECRSRNECAELGAALKQEGFPVTEGADALPERGEILLTEGTGEDGFELPTEHIAVLTLADEGDGERRRRRRSRYAGKRAGAGDKILSYAELHEGDYVVHAMHGIGRFIGMQTLTVDGVAADYITLQYAGQETLFLRADKLEMVSRYIGSHSEDGSVRLSKIGGAEWGRTKSRAKAAARDMAKELLALYADRQRKEGFAFPPEGDLEREFAASFQYEETDPQLLAIDEISADMERPIPMDRLLCGDVGFGKTEVALRAAFRAAVAGKQVAILVPTTILALQHYNTILSRMRGYPVNVEMLSRFRKPAEAQRILRRLARGEIDIIVGTHALLGKGVTFRDLGLLIVDEEQRFGVGQKERIKQMAVGVDVLTLTATPIPRTLNMAMNGIRDMSVLDEAPADRSPVTTFVMEHDELRIAEAMRRELARGGQVLYLYNRVDTIYRVAERVHAALPEARLAVAHGGMDRRELEDIWQELVLGEIDILVATTIIETGVDLPNANTLIIEDADRLGLAQLHQLRGRVGRSTRRAYAYCTYRPGKALSEIAEKRLEAIREYAEFGAGFRIALRDLEIRGAGNLLGAEQHGHIDAVGYDLYVRLLAEAVAEARGETPPPRPTATIDIPVSAFLPETYIKASAHRIDMYKKLALIETEADRADVLDELCDRFGEPPHPVLALLDVALCRATAAAAGIDRVELRAGELKFSFKHLSLEAWSEAFAEFPTLRITGTPPFVTLRLSHGEDAVSLALRVLLAYRRGMGADNSEKVKET